MFIDSNSFSIAAQDLWTFCLEFIFSWY